MSYTLLNNKPDIIIVGTGMGGATLGYALAKAGAKVLFLEKGLSSLADKNMLPGNYAETNALIQKNTDWTNTLKRSGRYYTPLHGISSGQSKAFNPFMGMGTGGSSALYGAILERFQPEDYAPGQFYTNSHESVSIPQNWPVSYQEMQPFYEEAEALYGVTNRSSQTDTAVSSANKLAWEILSKNGFHPYQLPTATEGIAGCKDNCQSFLCARNCKNDSAKCALRPAIEKYQAELIDDCEVLELIVKDNRIAGLICRTTEGEMQLQADQFVLAAGALATPALLLKSNGLANSSGLVGAYLMRHFVDLFAVKMQGIDTFSESQKQIGFNDFYIADEGKFGTVQSFGVMPPLEVVIEELRTTLPFGLGRPVSQLMSLTSPLVSKGYEKFLNNKLFFADIIEDLPSKNNKVNYNNGRIEITYKLSTEDNRRIKIMRKKVVDAFRPLPVTVMEQANNNHRLAHACGTCRFGDNPNDSVLNRFNKTHDIDNLYVVDASFFPTSGGINPALTIAANALRVADAMVKA
jgi:choline dehydrogenase-like flavoprotein